MSPRRVSQRKLTFLRRYALPHLRFILNKTYGDRIHSGGSNEPPQFILDVTRDFYVSHIKVPSTDFQVPSSDFQVPSSETRVPRPETRAPRSEFRGPSSDTRDPRPELRDPIS